MNPDLFAREVFRLGPFEVSDTLITSVAISVVIALSCALLLRWSAARTALEMAYESLTHSIQEMASADVTPLVPLILTLWLFLGVANLAGLVPGVASPTRDLSIATALALVSFLAGHIFAFRALGVRYLKGYLQPHPLLLPFNLIGELSRTLALALRLFGNMLSGHLVVAILLYLAGFLLPIPLMLLSVITGVVQAYIFGVLTLIFAVSSLEVAAREQSDLRAAAEQLGQNSPSTKERTE